MIPVKEDVSYNKSRTYSRENGFLFYGQEEQSIEVMSYEKMVQLALVFCT